MTATHAYPVDATATKPFKGSFAQSCQRCGGTGVWNGGYRKGVCFRCGGHGSDPKASRQWVFPTAWSTEQVEAFLAKKEEARCKRASKKTDKRLVQMEANCALHPAVAALRASWLADDESPEAQLWYTVSTVATDIMWKAFQYPLSEKQLALIVTQVERATERIAAKAVTDAERAEQKANAKPVPTGRVVITGKVVSRKFYEGDFGSTCKLLIVGDDGWKVFVTEPKAIITTVGDVVELTCNVTAADDDPTFGKGKRPTQAKILEASNG